MLAHISPVRAAARKLNLLWRGEQSIVFSANSLHDSLGKSTLQQLHQGINGPGTVLADGFPARLADRRDFHTDFIDGRAAHKRFHFTEGNLQIDDGTIAHVSAAAGQTICVITVTFQILAPGFSPEGCSNAAAFNLDRRDDVPLFLQLRDLAHRLRLPLRDRHIGSPSPASVVHVHTSAWARSEEHTSELQSRLHLVCRLLLEKTKSQIPARHSTHGTAHPAPPV